MLDEVLADQARRLGINISAAARAGVASAVADALAQIDRSAYVSDPEATDGFCGETEAWSDE